MAGHGGGAWKVAYADFVTAMMAFFLVMWITAQNTKVKTAIAHYFNQAEEAPKRPSRHPRDESDEPPKHILQPVMPSLTTDPADPEARVPRVLTMREGDRSSVGTYVYFADGSAELDDVAQKRLTRLLPWIVGKPQKIEVRGHAPDSPQAKSDHGAEAGSSLAAWQLSYARCLAVMKFLEANGIPAHRLRLSQAGPHEPLTTRTEPLWQARNPRVEVFVLNENTQDYFGTRDERARKEESH
jgi:chemotaxis protein MotB